MFDVGRSMFDVQSFHYSGQAEFYTKVQVSARFKGQGTENTKLMTRGRLSSVIRLLFSVI